MKSLPLSDFRLPRRTPRGFTLIELLVVISIIALLSTIGLTVYSSVQKSARDAVRRVAIDSFAKSLEVSRDPVTGTYNYTPSAFAADFPTPPVDPVASYNGYCLSTSTSTSVNITPPVYPVTPTPCPAGWTKITDYLSPTPFPTGTQGWMVCARLESNGSNFCKSSLSR